MRKTFTLIFLGAILVMISPVRSNAQNYYSNYNSYKPVSMGITFSPNLDWLRYGDEPGFDGTAGLGFAYGLLADFGVAENYYFSTGLLINQLYADASYMVPVNWAPGSSSNIKAQYRLQYVEIPVAVKLKSTEAYNRSYYGKFGFTPGVKTSGRERINDASTRTKIEDANIFRLALQIGGGVEWRLDHNLRLMTGLTFNNGFTRSMKLGEPKFSYLSLDFGVFF